MSQRPVPRLLVPSLSFAFLLAACSSGSGGSGDSFQLTRISLLEGSVWKVNQEIVFTFSADVDFSSVSLNTISIQTTTGTPATGTFFLRGTDQVVFQPNCPTANDLSDTGLQAGGIDYVIRVPGQSSGAANTVRSSSGTALAVTQVRNFSTPTSTDPRQAFLDTEQGPPVPVVRAEGSSEENATYLEVGGDPDDRVYFERDAAQNLVLSVPGFEAPLNLYSDPSSRVAVVIEFNQALNPSDTNVNATRMRLEFLDRTGTWVPLETTVALVGNCTESGARVRLEPIGILPQGSRLRAFIEAGLTDLVGETSLSPIFNFAEAPTRALAFTSLTPADSGSDEFPESFTTGGTSASSFQDTEALFDSPAALWGNGRLTAAFSFQASGGPGGAFDWLVRDGDRLVVDTDDGSITATDGTVQLIDDGVIDVRNMTIELGGSVRVQGSQPLRINATGDVIIRGTLDVSGFDARDVDTVNTGDHKEVGGTRGPGGGFGGDASEVVTNSTPRGSAGQGPNGEIDAGGQGGESGFAAASAGKDSRRPGGGGGGRFAPDQAGAGLSAGTGLDGSASATGAVTAQQPPLGGGISSGPFVDGDSTNDFSGTKPVGSVGNVTALIRGELPSLWGGYGGGGGGNADPANVFPTPNWTPASDEKGGAGGGGGGGLHIRALGRIQFGAAGLIRCAGGRGAVGENVQTQDHIGGNGGSGSGGHVILETASFIDFTDGGAAPNTPSRDWIDAKGGPRITGFETVPDNLSDGGAGGPGVIQFHVPEPLRAPNTNSTLSDIVVTFPAQGANALDNIASPPAIVLVPAFGARSKARSKWISIGGADQRPSAPPALLQFLFQGIDTSGGADDGKVLVSGEEVAPLAPLLDEDLEGNPNATVLADRLTLSLTGASLAPFSLTTNGVSNDLYLRTPALLEEFVLRLSVGAIEQDYAVARASYSEGTASAGDERLELTVVDDGIDLVDFIDANTASGTVHYELVPRHFLVATGGVANALPSTAFVRLLFQGTQDDGTGSPDESNLLVDWTGDISQFNALAAGQLQFFRFEVEFELAAGGGSVSSDTQAVSLDFLKIPFVF